MKPEMIKPIPKYILKQIKRIDNAEYSTPSGHTRFYSYLAKNDKELVKITVAVRHKYNNWHYKQCAVHGIHSEKCFVKDMCFTYIAGYTVGWNSEGLTKYPKWYEDSEWGFADDKYFDVYAPVINMNYLDKFPEYKYSAINLYSHNRVLQYLRLYEKYPQMEYLMKAGFCSIAQSKTILKRIGKDKKFCKWLMRNKDIIQNNYFYNDVILRSYTSGKDINLLQREKEMKLKFAHDDYYKNLKRRFSEDRLKQLTNYLIEKDVNASSYVDYLNACEYLHLDMEQDKNLFPHDFKRWHDIRSDEYATKKAMADRKEREELYKNFEKVAEKYLALQNYTKGDYAILIARSPADLIREGEILDHCVGRMGYDQKFVREETLIFFIRSKADVETPFVTVEYSLKNKKVLQCYGEGDSRPDDSVITFVNKKWLPYANRQIKKLQIAA